MTNSDGARRGCGPWLIFFNHASGHLDKNETRLAIEHAMQAAGEDVRYLSRQPDQNLEDALVYAFDEALACQGTVVVAGGDGTINAAASIAIDQEQALGIIPVGTFNFVARTHGIPEDIPGAVAVLLAENAKASRAGLINNQRFLVNASIGSYARLQRERETAKKTIGRSRTVATIAAVLSALRGSAPMRVQLDVQGESRQLKCSTIILCNNRLQLKLVGIDSLPGDSDEELACAVLAPVSIITQLVMIWRGWRGKVSETPELQTFLFDHLQLNIKRRRSRLIDVAVDGELHRMSLPLDVRVSDKPLLLIRPGQHIGTV